MVFVRVLAAARMTAWLKRHGHAVNRKRIRRLMRLMGIEAIYQKPNTSGRALAHKVCPCLLRCLAIERVNQIWCAGARRAEARPSRRSTMPSAPSAS